MKNNNPNNDGYVDVCDDECQSVPVDLLMSHLESNSIKWYVHIKISSSFHYPLCSIVYNTSTCGEDTPCSSSSSSQELTFQLTQGGEIINDEN